MLIFEGRIRDMLKKPFGPVHKTVPAGMLSGRKIAAVGDFCIRRLSEAGVEPDIAVFDFMCMRRPIDEETRKLIEKKYPNPIRVENAAGTITDGLAGILSKAAEEEKAAVRVLGEEDLSSLALMAILPDGWVLAYGQPGEGMVLVEASEKIRGDAKSLMESARKG